jgi:hypothetical protein
MRGLRRDFVQANIAPVGQGIATDDLRFSRSLLPKLLRQTRFLAVFGLESLRDLPHLEQLAIAKLLRSARGEE